MGKPTKVGENGDILHRFPLRKDFAVELVLPEDLTMEDVQRMSKWLATLPFDQRRARGSSDD